LHLWATGVIDVTTAVITAEGDCEMTTTTENEQTAQVTAAATEKPEAPKKAHVGARKGRVAPSKPKAGKKTTSAKKGAKAPKKAKSAKAEPRTEQRQRGRLRLHNIIELICFILQYPPILVQLQDVETYIFSG
jgi:hypothetical protein